MKKIISIFACVATVLSAVSCQKEAATTPQGEAVFTLQATLPAAKTYLGEKSGKTTPVLWATGDVINVNGVNSNPLAQGGGSKAEFTFGQQLTAPFNAVYPGAALSDGNVTVQRIQNYVEGSFDPATAILLGAGDASQVSFKNAMAYVCITPTLGSENVKLTAVELNSYSKKISGVFAPDFQNGTLAYAGEDGTGYRSEIFFSEPLALGNKIMFAIPAQQYTDKIDITLVEESGKSMTVSSEAFTATAGTIYYPTFAYKADVLGLPAGLTLYGPGQPGGWNTGTKLENKGNGIYSAQKVNLNNGVIKIYRLNSSDEFLWSEPYYIDTETKSTTSKGVIALRAIPIEGWPGDPAISISNWGLDNGTYDVSVNLNDNTLTLTESSEVVYPEKLYTCGPAFPCGWNLGSMVLTQGESGIYTIEDVTFVDKDGAFKFWERTDWGGEYYYNGTSDTSKHTAGLKPMEGSDSPWTLSTFGFTDINYYYDITVNLKTKVVSLVQGASIEDASPAYIYLLGDATPDGWNFTDGNKLQKQSPWVYSGSMNFNLSWENENGQGFKIYTTASWSPEYGMHSSSTKNNITMGPTSESGYDQVYLKKLGYTSGTHTITVDFNTMKITVE